MRYQAGAAQQLSASQSNERRGHLAMATLPFNPHDAIFHCLAWPEITPLRMMPASEHRYELTTIRKIFDGHTWVNVPNENKISHRW